MIETDQRLTRREFLWGVANATALLTVSGPALAARTLPLRKDGFVNSAFTHLTDVMDQYHRRFDVYTEDFAGGNHFFPSGWMGDLDAIQFSSDSIEHPHSGITCVKCTFLARAHNWAGIYWQHPAENWGTVENSGYDLTGATKLTFWARGAKGGERVDFFAGGIGRSSTRGCPPVQNAPDSLCKISTGFVTLSSVWQPFTIPLAGQDLSRVIGGFGWSTNSEANPSGATFFLDDIQYDLPRHDELRFLVSYETKSSGLPDRVLRNAAFLYDNVLALLAFTARGKDDDWRRAKILADSLVFAQEHDRFFQDGRLRNAYQAGDLADPGNNSARLPGRWDEKEQKWFEDRFQVSSHTGNIAWAVIGLLRYFEKRGGIRYLESAVRLGEWIHSRTYDRRGAGGYTGGFDGWDPDPEKIFWKSTEHNIDVYVAFIKLWELTGNREWRRRGMWAKQFVKKMWNPEGGHFWMGTLEDGATINQATVPADVQTWALMALGEITMYGEAMSWVKKNCLVEEGCCSTKKLTGFDFNSDRDGIWWEGTAHAVIAFQIKRELARATNFLQILRLVQTCAPNANGKGIVAACHDGVSTGLDWQYFNRLHVGATAWYLLAELKHNPFWGISTDEPIPCEGEYG